MSTVIFYEGTTNHKHNDIVKIGSNCIIGTNVVLGSDGFGYNDDLTHKEHKFGVILEDNVIIHPLVNIARGSWRDTVIGEGTRIDSFAHIAHNVIIGKNCLIGAGAMILGSVQIGDNTKIWSNSTINQRTKIGSNVIIGANTYIRHDVSDNELWYGNPAKKIRMV